MKKFLSVIVIVLTLCLCIFAGCKKDDTQTYTGEYGYEQYGVNYGVKVGVKVKDGVIQGVEILDSDYVPATPEDIWDDKSVWDNGLDELLKSYQGKTVEEVSAVKVDVKSDGEPYTNDDDVQEPITYDGLITTGATLGSGRLLLAVQNALENYGK